MDESREEGNRSDQCLYEGSLREAVEVSTLVKCEESEKRVRREKGPVSTFNDWRVDNKMKQRIFEDEKETKFKKRFDIG